MGVTFTKRGAKLYRYYLCVHASKNGYASCPVKCVAAGEIEAAVMGQLRGVFRSPDLIARTYRAARCKEAAELERMRREKGEVEDRLRVLKEMAAGLKRDGKKRNGSGDAAAAELDRVREEIAQTENRLAATARDLQLRKATELTERDVIDALQTIDPVWNELFPAEQARVVQLLVDSVIVNPDGLEVSVRSNGLRSLITELKSTVGKARERSGKK
jgi:site-specific DNA recombinase